MNFASWKDFHDIEDHDERLITKTLLIDIVNNLIEHPHEEKHHILPMEYIDEMFSRYPSALSCLIAMGFEKVKGR